MIRLSVRRKAATRTTRNEMGFSLKIVSQNEDIANGMRRKIAVKPFFHHHLLNGCVISVTKWSV